MGTGSQSHGWRGVASTASASSGDTTVLSRVTDVKSRIFETIENSITSSHWNTDDNVYDRHQKIQSALLNGGRILLHLPRVRARLPEERSALSCIPGPCIRSHYDGPTYSEGDIATRSNELVLRTSSSRAPVSLPLPDPFHPCPTGKLLHVNRLCPFHC